MNEHPYSRRAFVNTFARYLALGSLSLPAIHGCENAKNKETANFDIKKKTDKLGIALVGLGAYSTEQLAPALQQTKHCFLAGIVTGTPAKADQWRAKYNIPERSIYNYTTFDNIKNNGDIHIVYVVLPNALHREYVIRAAEQESM